MYSLRISLKEVAYCCQLSEFSIRLQNHYLLSFIIEIISNVLCVCSLLKG